MRRGLPVDRGRERQDDLLHAAARRVAPFARGARHQASHVELVGASPVDRGEGAAEHVVAAPEGATALQRPEVRSEEHTSELQSLMRISYAVFCLKKKKQKQQNTTHRSTQ